MIMEHAFWATAAIAQRYARARDAANTALHVAAVSRYQEPKAGSAVAWEGYNGEGGESLAAAAADA